MSDFSRFFKKAGRGDFAKGQEEEAKKRDLQDLSEEEKMKILDKAEKEGWSFQDGGISSVTPPVDKSFQESDEAQARRQAWEDRVRRGNRDELSKSEVHQMVTGIKPKTEEERLIEESDREAEEYNSPTQSWKRAAIRAGEVFGLEDGGTVKKRALMNKIGGYEDGGSLFTSAADPEELERVRRKVQALRAYKEGLGQGFGGALSDEEQRDVDQQAMGLERERSSALGEFTPETSDEEAEDIRQKQLLRAMVGEDEFEDGRVSLPKRLKSFDEMTEEEARRALEIQDIISRSRQGE